MVRAGVGLTLGAVTAAMTVACLAVAGLVIAPTLAWPGRRAAALRVVHTGVLRLAGLKQWRLGRYLGDPVSAGYRGYGWERALTYLGLRWPVGLLGGMILLLSAYGAGTMAVFGYLWTRGEEPDGIAFEWWVALYLVTFCLVLAFLALQGLIGVVRLERRLAHRFLGPTDTDALRRRIEELATSRAEVVEAVGGAPPNDPVETTGQSGGSWAASFVVSALRLGSAAAFSASSARSASASRFC